VDEGTWARGRGWGLWKALQELHEQRHTRSALAAGSQAVIEDILAEPQ
jgi:hypothetical protein